MKGLKTLFGTEVLDGFSVFALSRIDLCLVSGCLLWLWLYEVAYMRISFYLYLWLAFNFRFDLLLYLYLQLYC